MSNRPLNNEEAKIYRYLYYDYTNQLTQIDFYQSLGNPDRHYIAPDDKIWDSLLHDLQLEIVFYLSGKLDPDDFYNLNLLLNMFWTHINLNRVYKAYSPTFQKNFFTYCNQIKNNLIDEVVQKLQPHYPPEIFEIFYAKVIEPDKTAPASQLSYFKKYFVNIGTDNFGYDVNNFLKNCIYNGLAYIIEEKKKINTNNIQQYPWTVSEITKIADALNVLKKDNDGNIDFQQTQLEIKTVLQNKPSRYKFTLTDVNMVTVYFSRIISKTYWWEEVVDHALIDFANQDFSKFLPEAQNKENIYIKHNKKLVSNNQRPPADWGDKLKGIQSYKNFRIIIKKALSDTNDTEVWKAREQLIMFYNVNQEAFLQLLTKYLHQDENITSVNLDKKVKQIIEDKMCNEWVKDDPKLPEHVQQIIQQVYKDTKPPHRWMGFVNLVTAKALKDYPYQLNQMVEGIKVLDKDVNTNEINFIVQEVVKTILAIDTRINYDKLSIFIEPGTMKGNTGGEYNGQGIVIYTKSPGFNLLKGHIVSHEFGHYLDHRWGTHNFHPFSRAKYVGTERPLTYYPYPHPNEAFQEWYNRISKIYLMQSQNEALWCYYFLKFILELRKNAKVDTRYFNDNSEIFARFVANFVQWVEANLNTQTKEISSYVNEIWDEQYFIKFIKLLQERSKIDAELENVLY